MNLEDIKNLDQIIERCECIWYGCLHRQIKKHNPDFTFEENKEAFLLTMNMLLATGRIRLFEKQGPEQGSPRIYWDLPSAEIIDRFREWWPPESEFDEIYFFDMPFPQWYDENGNESVC